LVRIIPWRRDRLPTPVASLVAQTVKSLPAVWETWVQLLGWEDPGRKAWRPLQYSLEPGYQIAI